MKHELASHLFRRKHANRNRFFVSKKKTHQFLQDILEILYPHFNQNFIQSEDDLYIYLNKTELLLIQILHDFMPHQEAQQIAVTFFSNLEFVRDQLDLDAEAIFVGDPAASSIDEVILCYPGFFAMCIYRIANIFYKAQVKTLPRIFSEYAHEITGIDIHPGARIGERICIDHGTGIVIGETSVIGKNVKIYQGVTLGALSLDKCDQNTKRHPTIEDNCVIYSNATILGGKTVIGENSIVGGNVWLTKSIPKNSIVYHKSDIKMDIIKPNSAPEEIFYEI